MCWQAILRGGRLHCTAVVTLGLAAALFGATWRAASAQAQRSAGREKVQIPHKTFYVDADRGNDTWPGTKEAPKQTLSAAVASLPDPLAYSVTIQLAAGRDGAIVANEMPTYSLELMRSMRPGIQVKIVGVNDADGLPSTLSWEGNTTMIDVREGDWWLENLQIGTFTKRQRRGVMVTGPAHVTLKNVTFRLRSLSDAAIYACRGGQVSLRGVIRINEHLHDQADAETFSGIIATEHGIVRFREREGAALDMGNGSLSTSYYGVIRLGCDTARITSWNEQSNNLAINNGGRIDLHNTTLTLRATQRRNTPIGLEHDGHILGEGARVIIETDNSMAIALQKASTFTCNDIDLRGQYEYCMWASSGSMFVGRFSCDLGRVEATTGANINIEELRGRLVGPVTAKHCGTVSLPDRNVFSE